MGIMDKVTGRVKQAAGDLSGSQSLRREGQQEERKGDAKEELAREDAKVEREEARAQRETAKAQREADAVAEREQERVEQNRARADRKADEVAKLEGRTNPDAVAEGESKDELYARAQELDIEGRSDMTKDELAEAIRRHE